MGISDWVAVAEYGIAFLALVTFVAGYLASSHGRALRTREGRHLLHFRASLALWMALGVVNNIVGDYPARDWVRNLVIGWFVFAALGGNVLMFRAQAANRRHRREERAQLDGHELAIVRRPDAGQ